jgi:hypothetical protein
MRLQRRRRALASALALLLGLGGCAVRGPVQPWEKGVLARPDMGFDQDPLEAAFSAQTYGSKEAANGGAGASASGCGCN